MSIRHRVRMLMLGLVAAVAIGCAAPESTTASPASAEASKPAASTPAASKPQPPASGAREIDRSVSRDAPRETSRPAPDRAPPMSDPLPPQVEEKKPAAGGTVTVDRSCRTDADCTVKNVGNCCGYFPACVNVNSPTDPKGVQAQCAKDGMASVCGFEEIRGCQCVRGECQGDSSARLIQ